MSETLAIAAFRSRQQVQFFESLLVRQGLMAHVINTPHEIAIGCGVSVRFNEGDYDRVLRTYETYRASLGSLVGFYRGVWQGTQLKVVPLYKRAMP